MVFTYVPRGLIISIDENTFFDKDSYKIKKESACILKEIGSILKSIEQPCVVESHTNSLNPDNSVYKSNWGFSLARANNIVIYLMRCSGIDNQKIFPLGFGEIVPFEDNKANEQKLDNRIDFVIIDYGKLSYN